MKKKNTMKYINPRTRLNRKKSFLKRHLPYWKLYLSIAIISGIVGYIILLGTIQFAKQLFSLRVYAPTHEVFAQEKITPTPTPTEREQIDAYIAEVFGNDADKFNSVLDCENHARNPLAKNYNDDKYNSIDWGIAQINDHWQGVTNPAFLTDWKINILMAHNIYTRDGSFKLWTCGRKLGI